MYQKQKDNFINYNIGCLDVIREGKVVLSKSKIKLPFQTLIILGVIFLSMIYTRAFFGDISEYIQSSSNVITIFFWFFSFLIIPTTVLIDRTILIIRDILSDEKTIIVDHGSLSSSNKYYLAILILILSIVAFSFLVLFQIISNLSMLSFIITLYLYITIVYFFALIFFTKYNFSPWRSFGESIKLVKKNFRIVSIFLFFSSVTFIFMSWTLYIFSSNMSLLNLNPYFGLLLFFLTFSVFLYLLSWIVCSAVILFKLLHLERQYQI